MNYKNSKENISSDDSNLEDFDIESLLIKDVVSNGDKPDGDSSGKQTDSSRFLMTEIVQGLLMAHARLDEIDGHMREIFNSVNNDHKNALSQSIKQIDTAHSSMSARLDKNLIAIQENDKKLTAIQQNDKKLIAAIEDSKRANANRADTDHKELVARIRALESNYKADLRTGLDLVGSDIKSVSDTFLTMSNAVIARIEYLQSTVDEEAHRLHVRDMIIMAFGFVVLVLILLKMKMN